MSDTVQITIPPNAFTIHYTDSDRKDHWSFAACARWIVDHQPRFNGTGQGIRQGMEIMLKIDGVAEGEKTEPMKRADVVALSESFENPESGYMPPVRMVDAEGKPFMKTIPGRTFVSYLDAVANALKSE